jgi:hypothetical protein
MDQEFGREAGQVPLANGHANGINDLADNSLQITARTAKPRGPGRPFLPGQSGNPAGRPRGNRNSASLLIKAMIYNEAELLARTVLDRALYRNDAAAMRLCMERLIAPRRSEVVEFDMPPLADANDATGALAAIAQAVADGELSPAEAGHLSALVDRFVHSLEARQLEARLTALEQADAKAASARAQA